MSKVMRVSLRPIGQIDREDEVFSMAQALTIREKYDQECRSRLLVVFGWSH